MSSLPWYCHRWRAMDVSSPLCIVLTCLEILLRNSCMVFSTYSFGQLHDAMYIMPFVLQFMNCFNLWVEPSRGFLNSLILGRYLQKEHVPHGYDPFIGGFSQVLGGFSVWRLLCTKMSLQFWPRLYVILGITSTRSESAAKMDQCLLRTWFIYLA